MTDRFKSLAAKGDAAMEWDQEVNAAETLLHCATVPSSEQTGRVAVSDYGLRVNG